MINKSYKKISIVCLATVLAVATFSACSDDTATTDKDKLKDKVIAVEYTDRDKENTCTEDGTINLSGSSITSDAEGVTVKDSVATINKKGTYKVSGKLDNGQIAIAVEEEDKVQLLLDNATINCDFGPAIYSNSADKIFITTAKGTTNTITDGTEYTLEDDQPYGAIFATCGVTLNGEGTLKVKGNYNNGIVSKDDLKITGGTIQVEAVNNGLKGTDSVAIKDGDISVVSTGDGIKSSKEENDSKGYVSIEGGKVSVESGTDAIQAENIVQVIGGEVSVKTAGGYENASKAEETIGKGMPGEMPGKVSDAEENTDDISAKGLKGGKYVLLTGGKVTANTLDDAVHTNGSLLAGGTDLQIQAGDDGFHADQLTYINGGNINVANSYEGIEGARVIVDDGKVNITASDDGINAAGGNDASGQGGPMADVPRGGGQMGDNGGKQPQGQEPQQQGGGQDGQNPQETNKDNFMESSSIDYVLEINGGEININCEGDGLDSNKDIEITGGKTYVNGPSNPGNGAIDCGEENNGVATITGGEVIAVGADGMAATFDSSSTQASLMYNASGKKGDEIILKDSSGKEVFKYTAIKEFGNIVLSTPDMKQGEKYTLSVGDKDYDVELTDISTSYGEQTMAPGGGGGQNQGGPGGQNQGGPGGQNQDGDMQRGGPNEQKQGNPGEQN